MGKGRVGEGGKGTAGDDDSWVVASEKATVRGGLEGRGLLGLLSSDCRSVAAEAMGGGEATNGVIAMALAIAGGMEG
jgi:hypothetical protein